MKKLPFLFAVVSVLIISACDHNWKYAVISNNSDYPVNFKFRNIDGEHYLPARQRQTFENNWKSLLEYYTPGKRVSYSYTSNFSSFYGAFENLPSWKLRVFNNTPEPASLTADEWMDPMENISAGKADDANHNGLIFTDKPSFTVITSGFPAAAEYQIVDGVMYVTISY
jgi:hypothetical protein